MKFDDYRRYDAIGLADLINRREVSAREVCEAAIARTQAINPQINAVVHERFERALAEIDAGLPEGPLTGVPYLIKDLAFFQAGEPATMGSRLFDGNIADHDSAYTARCKQAGLALLGRTNSPEFGLSANTEPVAHGSCRNPWNLEYSAGGSSGGAAAAVAAGILPMAHATDGGGSIRIPAAQCGLFGLKPSRGRISFAPDAGEGWGGLSIGHVNSRSVRDSAIMLDITSGAEDGDPYTAPPPNRPFLDEVGADPGPLRVGVLRKTHAGNPFHADNLAAIEDAAKLCESLGHIVEYTEPDLDLKTLRSYTAKLSQVQICRLLRNRWSALRLEPSPDQIETTTWATYQAGMRWTGVDYAEAIAAVHAVGRQFAKVMNQYDVLLSTTLTSPPPPLGWLDANGDPKVFSERLRQSIAVTPLHNATGTPAMSVPLYWNDDGLPIGVHFAGRYGDEARLLRLAAQLEEAKPWFERIPVL